MNHPRLLTRATLLAALLSLLVPLWATQAGAQDTPSPGVAAVGEERARLDAMIAEIADLNAKLAVATGDDAEALRRKAAEARLDAMEQLGTTVDRVLEAEAAGEEVAVQKAELSKLLASVNSSLRDRLDETRASIVALLEQRDAAAPAERLAVQQRIAHQNDLLGRLLSAGVAYLGMLERFGLETEAARASIEQIVSERVELLAGRIDLLATEIPAAEARVESTPDDADLRAEVDLLRARLDLSTAALQTTIEHMDALGLDATAYKQVLIEVTGEITADLFDRRVAQGLLGRWASGIRESIAQHGPGFLFRTVVVLLILGIFWGLSRLVRRVVERAMSAPNLRFSALLKRMVVSLSAGLVLVLGVLVALSQLGIQVGPVLAGLGIAGFIVGFALQETLANFAAGIMILTYRPYDVGDLIECAGGVFGRVNHMNLVQTTILTLDNQTRMVPNGKIWGDVITNLTAQKVRRVDMMFGIHYDDDIPHAEQIMRDVVEKHPKVVSDPEPIVRLHELGDSSVNFVVRPWTDPEDYWDVWWDITREVKLRFDAEGITIPFPQRDVHFYPATTNGSGQPVPIEASAPGRRTQETAHEVPDAD